VGEDGAGPDWDGGYFTNDDQRVTTEDAAALADALERALPDVPRHEAMAHKTVELPGGLRVMKADADESPLEWFSGEGRDQLVEFIRYCRAGEFVIG
jgi:hypothetical protein